MENYKMVSFKDLSKSLKVFVTIGWILIGLNGLAFIIGFLIGVASEIAL